ncbi:MAG: YqhA family protein [Hyphomicrobiales bacterium]|nr:YqhA family protein [Hyphomicrobiales bacterium]
MLKWLERALFTSRWLLVPFYAALVVSLMIMLARLFLHVYDMVLGIFTISENELLLHVLGVIDTTLTASMVILVIFSGYENFVSRVTPETHDNWPEWMTKIDFGGLKLKLLSTITAITAIHLLRAYLEVADGKAADLQWSVLVLLGFAATAVLLALGDFIAHKVRPD